MESRGGPAPPQLKRVLRRSSVPSFKHVERVRNSSATRVSMRFSNTRRFTGAVVTRAALHKQALFDESHDSSAGTVERLSPEPCRQAAACWKKSVKSED